MDDDVEIRVLVRFVLPKGKNEATCSEDLSYAFEQAQDIGLNPTWAPHDDVLVLNPTKTDVFVMDPFEGEAYNYVAKSKSTVVGPRCLLTCLQKGEPVPELPYPMYTAAMKGLIITSTGFDKRKKAHIQDRVEKMAGIYSNAFHDGVTHLVAAIVRSPKYEVAINKEIPVMTAEWIEQVWNRSMNDNVNAVDKQFIRYACPALMGLNICVSQMSSRDKELLKKSIEAHGGIYSKSLDMESTNVLITPTAEGEKFTYARKWKIPCLNSNWVFDSIEKGYCLPTESYNVLATRSSSTPTKEDVVSKLQEVSLCSTIMGPPGGDGTLVRVNETVSPNNSTVLNKNNGLEALEDLNRVKKSGLFLDGCRVFLQGFSESQQEHLRRVLQSAGATRMNQLTPSVTHAVFKSFAKTKMLKELGLDPFQVSLDWIVESMRLGRTAPESDFPAKTAPKQQSQTPSLPLPPPPPPEDLLSQYSKKCGGETDETTVVQVPMFLSGKKLALFGLDESVEQDLSEWISEAGGETVFHGEIEMEDDEIDYLVLPLFGVAAQNVDRFKAKEVVNNLWLDDCFDNEGFVPIEYFHRPMNIDLTLKPLEGVVLGTSGYTRRERLFICGIAQALGAIAQETFAKRDKGDSKKSTHLVCSAPPEGSKYEAAIKWGLPVIDKDWILICARKMTWISEKPFLLGEAEVFTEGKPVHNREQETKEQENEVRTPKVEESRRLDLETPGLDIEKLRPKRFEEEEEEFSPKTLNFPPDSQPSPSLKRKRQDEKPDLPFHLAIMKTPDTPYGAFLGNEDPSPTTRKYWKYRFEQIKSRNSEEDRKYLEEKNELLKKNLEKLEENRKLKKEKDEEFKKALKESFDPDRIKAEREKALDALEARGIPVLERSNRSFDDLMEDKLKKLGMSWKNPITIKRIKLIRQDKLEGIFKNVVIFISKKCSEHRNEISEVVKNLGGRVAETYAKEEVTHFIFSSGKANDLSKDFRQARDDGKAKIVAPEWIFMCRDENKLVEESIFPHTYNSRMTLSTTILSSSSVKKNKKKNLLLSKVDQLLHNSSTSEANGKMRMTLASTEATPERSLEGAKRKLFESNQGLDSMPQGGSQILWIDPKEADEREKLAAKLNSEQEEQELPKKANVQEEEEEEEEEKSPKKAEAEKTFESMDIPENFTSAMMDETSNKEDENKKKPVKKVFMISGISDAVRSSFISFLAKHKDSASFSDTNSCDPESTHIIATKLGRSEKMLGSIASGNWLLHSSYVSASIKADRLLPEAEFEWGNPENGFVDSLETELERQLAAASYKWRLKKEESRPPFSGIRAIIHTSAKRRGAFQRLLELGGGEVAIDAEPPYSILDLGDEEIITHCIAEPSKVPKARIDFKALADKGIPVVGPLYINEYLIMDPVPSVEDHLIPGFKTFWVNRKRNF